MPSLLPSYEYDIFISYRHKDNKRDGWVSEFVDILRDELDATLKEDVNLYFDGNEHDGLLETHDVDKSLDKKIKCLIFIPIISHTYCDANSFAWKNELLPFIEQAKQDEFGLFVQLENGNVASRVMPVRIHDIDSEDKALFEQVTEGHMRSIKFIYKTKGVNRPLRPLVDDPELNEYHTVYRDQINLVANGVKQLIKAMKTPEVDQKLITKEHQGDEHDDSHESLSFIQKVKYRNIPRAAFFYMLVSWLLMQLGELTITYFNGPEWMEKALLFSLLGGFLVAISLAWMYEKSPNGFIRTNSRAAKENPYSSVQKKPPASYAAMGVLIVISSILSIYTAKSGGVAPVKKGEVSLAIIPFRNNTGSEEHKHHGLGFANEIRSELSRSKQFDFISALEATTKYWNQFTPPKVIADELGVHYLLTGMYEIVGEQFKVSVELVDALTGQGVWNFEFNDKLHDVWDMQSDIAKMVLDEFELEHLGGEAELGTRNLEAYKHYLKGLEYHFDDTSIKKGLEAYNQYEQAVKLDSTYKLAWIGMIEMKSRIAFNKRFNNNDGSSSFSLEVAEEVNKLIKQFEYKFPEAYEINIAKGVYHYHGLYELEKGAQFFRKVLEYDPENYEANRYLSYIYIRQLKHQEALGHIRNVLKLKPNEVENWLSIVRIFESRGEYDIAMRAYDKALTLRDTVYYDFKERLNHYQGKPYPPDSINNPWRFWTQKFEFERRYQDLIYLCDTMSYAPDWEVDVLKTQAFMLMNNLDSAQFYAKKWKLKTTHPNALAAIGVILEDGLADVEYYDFIRKGYIQGDLLSYGNTVQWLIEVKSWAGKYEEATQLLVEFNNQYPEYGNYSYLRTQPGLDKIKAEYPPFVEALNNLKLPPPLEVEKFIKF